MGLTTELILSWQPCYGQEKSRRLWLRAFPSGEATVEQVLRSRRLLAADKIWLVTRPGVLPDAVLRRFAADCAYRALERHGGKNVDNRYVAAITAAVLHSEGAISDEELVTAWHATAAAHAAAWRTTTAAGAIGAIAATIGAIAATISYKHERHAQVAHLLDMVTGISRRKKEGK